MQALEIDLESLLNNIQKNYKINIHFTRREGKNKYAKFICTMSWYIC